MQMGSVSSSEAAKSELETKLLLGKWFFENSILQLISSICFLHFQSVLVMIHLCILETAFPFDLWLPLKAGSNHCTLSIQYSIWFKICSHWTLVDGMNKRKIDYWSSIMITLGNISCIIIGKWQYLCTVFSIVKCAKLFQILSGLNDIIYVTIEMSSM